MQQLSDRLKTRRKSLDLTQKEIARRLKVSQATVAGWESGNYKPGGRNILGLAKLLECDPQWLEYGSDPGVREQPESYGVTNNTREDLVKVPVRNAHLVASVDDSGFEIQYEHDETVHPRFYRREWLQKKGYKPEQLCVREVRGSSMESALFDGDFVLINMADREPSHGKVFSLVVEGQMVIKRLTKRSGAWWVCSDNPAYSKTDLPLESLEQIEGKVVERSGTNI